MRSVRWVALFVGACALSLSCTPGGDKQDDRVVAFFRDVGDLVERGTVQVNDVEVGVVSDIELVLVEGQMLARVEMAVNAKHRIQAGGLRALVRQTSLLGEQFIELIPAGTSPPFIGEEPATIPVELTDRRVDVETLLSDLSAFIGRGGLEDLNRFTHSQALILEDRGRRFGQTLDELEQFTGVLADRRLDIGSAIDHLSSAAHTLAGNRDTLEDFLDSLASANDLLADEGDDLRRLFGSLRRFGTVNARFLGRHEDAIDRQFQALRPILEGLASAEGDLRVDLAQLRIFFELFPKSVGGGPGGEGYGDYTQVEAVLCEVLTKCHTRGEKGDVPGEGS